MTDKAYLDGYCAGHEDGRRGTQPKADPHRGPYPALFAILYARLVEVAQAHGYCLALHGSLARDMDLVAVAWTETAAAPEVLAEAIRQRVGGVGTAGWPLETATGKPHGRLGFVISLGGGPYIDLSVIPPTAASDSARTAGNTPAGSSEPRGPEQGPGSAPVG